MNAYTSDLLGERLLPIKLVKEKAGLGQSTIYRRIAAGSFPAPYDRGGGRVGWKLSEIEEWLANRPRIERPG